MKLTRFGEFSLRFDRLSCRLIHSRQPVVRAWLARIQLHRPAQRLQGFWISLLPQAHGAQIKKRDSEIACARNRFFEQ